MLHIKACYRGGFEGRPGWWLHVTGAREFQRDIQELKHRIAPKDRAFNAEDSSWWIAEAEAPQLVGLIDGLDAFLRQPALPGF